ncbi:IS6 family transposase, partial [Litorivita pollutaquae]
MKKVESSDMDLSRFDAAPLIAFTATKETDYGIETDGRIPPGCGAYRADQWA